MGKRLRILLLGGFVLLMSPLIAEIQLSKTGDFSGQHILLKAAMGHTIPNQPTKMELCLKTEENGEYCDIAFVSCSFHPEALKRASLFLRKFFEEVFKTHEDIYTLSEAIITLKDNVTDELFQRTVFNKVEIEAGRHAKNEYTMLILKEDHELRELAQLEQEKYWTTGWANSTIIGEVSMVYVILKVHCRRPYYGDLCLDACEHGCKYGTCSNGTCTCAWPYHGVGCDQCGSVGECAHGDCVVDGAEDGTEIFPTTPIENGDENATAVTIPGVCECPPQWSGVNCEVLVLDCTVAGCQNKGTCNQTSTLCECHGSFVGEVCQEKVEDRVLSQGSVISALVSLCAVVVFITVTCWKMRTPTDAMTCGEILTELYEKIDPPTNRPPERDMRLEMIAQIEELDRIRGNIVHV